MKVNKYFPFAFIYFFVNSVALPFGSNLHGPACALLLFLDFTEEKKRDRLFLC
jgi:hypothetical protein